MTELLIIISIPALLFGLWMSNDGQQLALRVEKAEQLMSEGISEKAAMERSGCNWWDRPWYHRLFKGSEVQRYENVR